MVAQLASAMLIKVGDGGTPTETFTTLAGIRTKSMTLNAEEVDVTTADSANKWRELLGGAGIKTMAISGSGVFKDAATDATIRTEMFSQAIKNYQIVVPDFGTFEGAFQLTQLEYAGEHNGEVTYSIAMASAGEIAFTAA